MTSKNHYVNNAEFEELIERWQETQCPELLETITTDYLYVISYHIVKTFRFKLLDEQDALQDGALAGLKAIQYWRRGKGLAFNLATTCILNELRGRFKSETQRITLLEKYTAHCAHLMRNSDCQMERIPNVHD